MFQYDDGNGKGILLFKPIKEKFKYPRERVERK